MIPFFESADELKYAHRSHHFAIHDHRELVLVVPQLGPFILMSFSYIDNLEQALDGGVDAWKGKDDAIEQL